MQNILHFYQNLDEYSYKPDPYKPDKLEGELLLSQAGSSSSAATREIAYITPSNLNSSSHSYWISKEKTTIQTKQNKTKQKEITSTTALPARKPAARKGRVPTVKIPLPVFVASLPKSGTTSSNNYFECGKLLSRHTWTRQPNGKAVRIGRCMLDNIQAGRPPFYDCGPAQVWSDTGIINKKECYYPTVHGGLEKIYDAHPNATIVLFVRNKKAWGKSATKFNRLRNRWAESCERFPPKNATDAEFEDFYEWHNQNVRQFAQNHPSMTFLEFPLEGEETGAMMEETIGIPASCWNNWKPTKSQRERKRRKGK